MGVTGGEREERRRNELPIPPPPPPFGYHHHCQRREESAAPQLTDFRAVRPSEANGAKDEGRRRGRKETRRDARTDQRTEERRGLRSPGHGRRRERGRGVQWPDPQARKSCCSPSFLPISGGKGDREEGDSKTAPSSSTSCKICV